MNVLIIGGGGREHALAWKIAQSNAVEHVYVAPGNAGTAFEPKIENINIRADDISGLLDFVIENQVELTIVGPEAPLVIGIVDRFHNAGLNIFGPTQAAAQLEGSKTFCKDFLARHNIPTAHYASFTEVDTAIAYVQKQTLPLVIKADGLAAGKGVVIAHSEDEAVATIKDMLLSDSFGDAGHRIVIEAFLQGEEASFIVMSDGRHVLPMASSQDHKTRDNGDQGPNTGGMGAYSPAPVITPEIHERILETIIEPTIKGMAAEGHPYVGFLYAGLMIGKNGVPKVLEFNCRLGDPETQPILMRLESDLAAHCLAALAGKLDMEKAVWDKRVALGVVMAAGGYPGDYKKGQVVSGLKSIKEQNIKVFHAGTQLHKGSVVTSGGRVLCVTALGTTVTAAQQAAYHAVAKINWDHAYYRGDIGYKAVAREKMQNKK